MTTINADLGSDFAGVDDMDPNLSLVAGRDALAECSARGLMTPYGSLWYDVHWGEDLTKLVGSSTQDARVQSGARAQLLRDERVLGARVKVGREKDKITAALVLSDSRGAFPLTVVASALTLELLKR